MVNVKRDKRSRLRGARSCGRGARKKGRGSGQRGGVGMAGTGKKSAQKLVWLKKYAPGGYLGKRGFKSVRQRMHREFLSINIGDIDRRLGAFENEGLLKGKELNLEGYKVLGDGELKEKLTITAEKFSQSAKEKIEAAGGKAVETSEE
ncbi:MAG: 50S ribosomal protein L15 [Nanoarchaeota archaeon]|nr:50S ribosomal protein L15 [Nanoarchaeota archaeon]